MVTELNPARAVAELQQAVDRDHVFDILLRATRSKLRFAALVSVHPDQLRGRRAVADAGFSCDLFEALSIPRDTVPVFESAIASRAPSLHAIDPGEPGTGGLLRVLRGTPKTALVLPITNNAHTVALLVGHRGDEELTVAQVADLFVLGALAGPVLARVAEARSQAVGGPPARIAEVGGPIEARIAHRRKLLAEYRRDHAWAELAETIRELVRDGMHHGDPDEEEQLELLIELGHIEADMLGQPDNAIAAWRSAQAITRDPRILDALEALFVQQGDWLSCTEILDERVELATTDDARIALLLRIATLETERLDEPAWAIESYQRILALQPDHDEAARALERVYEEHGLWEPLAALLLARAARTEDEAQTAALEEAAQMYAERVGNPRAACLAWIAVFRREPERVEILDELDRLAPLAAAWDAILPECKAVAAELDDVKPELAARVWKLVGRWSRDHLVDRAGAMHALDRASIADPSDPEALAELVQLLTAAERWEELVGVLTRHADLEPDQSRRSELYAALGEVHDTRLGDVAQAIAFYEVALGFEPESTPILIALHRLYLDSEAWDALVALVPRLIDALSSTVPLAVIVALHVELAKVLADHLMRSDEAIRSFHDALALDPTDAEALAGLARVCEATGQTETLLEATEARIDAAGGAQQGEQYGAAAAAWHARGQYDRAIAAWEKLLALEPGNVAAYEGLAAALRADKQWNALATCLRAHAALVEPAASLPLLLELAGVLELVDDVNGATATYQAAVALDDRDQRALAALVRLHEQTGRSQLALAALQQLADRTSDPRTRADLLQRVGHGHLTMRDATLARAALAAAIELDPTNARAHEGLARVHLQRGELAPAGELLMRAAKLSASKPEMIGYLVDATALYRQRLGDPEKARACLDWILELDPSHADAQQARADLLHETKQWEALWPHLDEQVKRIGSNTPPVERHDLFTKAARCAVELGKFPIAIELYDRACALGPNPATERERAEALYRSKALAPAAAAYQAIANRAGALDRAQLLAVNRRLAQIHTELGNAPLAQMFHQRVLDADPAHRETLSELAELHLGRGRFEEAIASLRTLTKAATGAEHVTLLERIGDLYRHQLANLPRAISVYSEALQLDARNHRILQRLLDVQSEAGQWRAAVETIQAFLDREATAARRAAYFLAAAEIKRTELRDLPGALDSYEHALDELLREEPLRAPTRQRAIDTYRILEAMVTADKKWKLLEQSCARMIKRMPKDDPFLIELWHELGLNYRVHLADDAAALQAFEVAHSLDPDKSAERARILAELYARIGATPKPPPLPRAKRATTIDTSDPDAYRALKQHALDAGRIDEAWCACRALVLARQAEPAEDALYRKYQEHEDRKATGILDDDSWDAHVRHAEEDRVISSIFAVIWESVVALRAGSPKSFELKAKERVRVETDVRVIAKTFRHAARVLNVPVPDVYLQPRRPGRLLLANCIEKGRYTPAVIVGRDLATGYRDTEIAALVGAMVAMLRPTYNLKLTLGTVEELEAALAAAAQLVGKTVGRRELEPLTKVFVPAIQKRLTRPIGETLLALVNRLPATLDLVRWRNAVDATAQRAGLLVAGELAAATRMVSSESVSQGGLRPSQRVHELTLYSVSPAYFAARQHLGVAVA